MPLLADPDISSLVYLCFNPCIISGPALWIESFAVFAFKDTQIHRKLIIFDRIPFKDAPDQ